MDDLKKLRKKISRADMKLRKVFLKRMSYSTEMKKIKDQLNLPYEDKDREEYLKRKYAKDIVEYRKEYLELMNLIFKLSKEEMEK